MKAKEIINLCEDEQLDSWEIFNLIQDYFVKKMKSIGMEIVNHSLDVEANLVVSVTADYADVKRYSRAYIKKVSKFFGERLYSAYDGGTVNILHPNPVLFMWKEYPIFYFSSHFSKISLRSDHVHYIKVCVSFSNQVKSLVMSDSIKKHEEFFTEEGRKEIYGLIDSLAKFIRLTPLGK